MVNVGPLLPLQPHMLCCCVFGSFIQRGFANEGLETARNPHKMDAVTGKTKHE